MIPYGRQWIDDDDIEAVTKALKSDYLTTGPVVEEFEQAWCEYTGAKYAVAVSSGTAALHAAVDAIGIGPGDEVIVPAITFVATANCVKYQGADVSFVDVYPDTLLIKPEFRLLTESGAKAVISVDYAGQHCDVPKLRDMGRYIINDACHSLGNPDADINVHSFHPVKHITTGEGGMATTDNRLFAERMRRFRNHGRLGTEMISLGYNYRMSDIQAALGLSQLKKLDGWLARRREIADIYDTQFSDSPYITPLAKVAKHDYHLYVVRLSNLRVSRDVVLQTLRERGIGAQVHYKPVYQHPFYGEKTGLCPVAEKAYEEILTLPLYPQMTHVDICNVAITVEEVMEDYSC